MFLPIALWSLSLQSTCRLGIHFCLNHILVEQWIYLLIAIIRAPIGASIVGNDDFSCYFCSFSALLALLMHAVRVSASLRQGMMIETPGEFLSVASI
jgi:hypothetical protein